MGRGAIFGRAAFISLLVLLAAEPALATVYAKHSLKNVVASENHVAFLSNGLTVLDARTGQVVRREPGVRTLALYGTSYGILLATAPWFSDQLFSYRMLSAGGSGSDWKVNCDLWHLASDYLICVQSRYPVTVEARSLADGRVRWSYATGGRGGEALDAQGRLMLTNIEEEWVEHHERGVSGVRRVKKLAVLDFETGRVLASTDVNDVVLRGWEGHENHQFDGERVLLRRKEGSDPGCPRNAVRVYTLDLADKKFTARDECEPDIPPPHEDQPAWTEVERRLDARAYPLDEGHLVAFRQFGAGTLFELRSEKGHWQALLPFSSSETHSGWQFSRAFERRGRLFIESESWTFGTLDCLDLASGRPLWRYVFPALPELVSTSGFGPSWRPYLSKSQWREVKNNPPPPLALFARRYSLDQYLQPQTMAAEATPASAPVIFDPAGIIIRWKLPWSLVAIGLALFVASFRKHMAPPRSLHRLLMALGLFLYLVMILLYLGRIEFFAGSAMKILLVVAYFRFGVAAIRTQTLSWLGRGCFLLLLLPMGWYVLFLLLVV